MALNKFSLIIKKTQTGIVVLYPSEKENLLFGSKEVSFIRIKLKSKNPYFFNFTELNHRLGDQIYYLSNRITFRPKEDTTERRLHSGVYLNDKYLALNCGPNANLSTHFPLGNSEVSGISQSLDSVVQIEEQTKAGDIFGGDFGVYQIKTESDVEPIRLVYEKDPTPRVFAVCDLLLSSTYLAKNPEELHRKFTIRLKNRAVYWRYYFVNQQESLFDDVQIFDGKQKVDLSEAKQVNLINNRMAKRVTFIEKRLLFNKYPDVKLLATIGERSGISKTKSIKLPTPSSEKVGVFSDFGDDSFIVEMYVNV